MCRWRGRPKHHMRTFRQLKFLKHGPIVSVGKRAMSTGNRRASSRNEAALGQCHETRRAHWLLCLERNERNTLRETFFDLSDLLDLGGSAAPQQRIDRLGGS